jgi:hypothetical protein
VWDIIINIFIVRLIMELAQSEKRLTESGDGADSDHDSLDADALSDQGSASEDESDDAERNQPPAPQETFLTNGNESEILEAQCDVIITAVDSPELFYVVK